MQTALRAGWNTSRLLAITALAALLLGLLLPNRGLYGIDICGFHRMTGMPCPGCGMTRAFTALSHGHFARAWALHPFVYPVYAATLGFLVSPLLVRFPHLQSPVITRGLRILAGALGIAMLIFGIARMCGYFPWP